MRVPLNNNEQPQDSTRDDVLEVRRIKLRRQFEDLQLEFKSYAFDTSPAGRAKRNDIARKLQNFPREEAFGAEEMVDVTVTSDHLGFPFWINDTEYRPGIHRVPASVAQTLRHMMDANHRAGQRVFQSRGKNVNMGEIGDSARAAQIMGED